MESGGTFYSIIVHYEIVISDIPAVQETSSMANIKTSISDYKYKMNQRFIYATLTKIG